jgi:hypothetical protein
VPNVMELKDKILRETHESAYIGGNKMYHQGHLLVVWNEEGCC